MMNEFNFEHIYGEILNIEEKLREYRTWTEDFEDEEKHEVVTVERNEVIGMREPNATEAARIAELEACILAHVQELSDDDLSTMYYRTHKLAYLEEAMARNLKWATEDDDDDINDVTYTITADSSAALDAVETLIDELCNRVGTPENVADGLSMQIPYADTMQLLIGNNRFTGLIDYKKRTADALILTCQCTERCIYALAEALEETLGVKVEVNLITSKP